MLYLAIPAHNEVATIGVLLWRLRTVLAEFPREYEVVVYDDASTDETADVAEQYAHAMPVTVLRGTARVGYAGALDALIRYVSAQTRYPRRDAMLLMQGDFTDPPGLVPEFARRFEGGADLVVGERMVVADAPVPVRRLFKAAHWSMRPFVRVDGVRDLTASMRLIRISALRDLVRQAGSAPVCVGDSWTANADLLLKLVPLARRVESVPLEPTYGVRMRETRRIAVRDGLAVLKWAWGARGRRAEAGSAADTSGDSERRPPRGGAAGKRRDEPELSVEKLRERVRERPRVEDEESFNGRREGRRRERERARSERGDDAPVEGTADQADERTTERTTPAPDAPRPERAAAPERAKRDEPKERPERTKPERAKRERGGSPDGEAKTIRPERLPRGQRAARGDAPAAPRRARSDERSPYSDPTVSLDDPFAAPAGRRGTRDQGTTDAAPADSSAPAETEPMSAPGASPVLESMSVSPASRAESASTDDADAGDGADGDEGEESTDTAEGTGVRRKRRRNRRSRRGRARKDGATGDEGSDAAGDTEGDDAGNASGDDRPGDDAPAARSDRPSAGAGRRSRSRGGAQPTPEGEGTPEDNADDRDDSAAHADESEEERAARARRRGRRGRRGGARRSRGRRDKDGGEGGDAGSGDAERSGGSDGGDAGE